MYTRIRLFIIVLFAGSLTLAVGQEGNHGTQQPEAAHSAPAEKKYDPVATVMHHIGNSNEFHIVGNWSIPLPCILYSKEDGFRFFMSNKFHHGSKAVDKYVLEHGVVRRIKGEFPQGEVELEPIHHEGAAEEGEHHYSFKKEMDGKEVSFVNADGAEYELERAATLMHNTSFYDFSISKNVFAMLLATFILFFVFLKVARMSKERAGKAPKGIQSLIETVFIFIRDEVAKPMIGHQYERFLPLLMSLFFFILVLNLLGLIPFFPGSANVTGNLATTMVLAIITFIVTNINGNKHYWGHVLWMPGLPLAIKPLISAIEIIGLFTKPFSLMMRLFANITAGHIIILSLVGLIFVFGNAGESIPGSIGGAAIAIPFTIFMNLIELLVAFLQAYIFTMLAASYIGAAVEEHH